jgi:hypothetical protein
VFTGHPWVLLDDCRHPLQRGRCGPCQEIFTARIPRLHEMDVGVDHPGEDKASARIDDLPRLRGAFGRRQGSYPAVPKADVQWPSPILPDDGSSPDGEVERRVASAHRQVDTVLLRAAR